MQHQFSMVATAVIDKCGLAAQPGDILEHVTPIQVAMLKYQRLAREATPDDYATCALEPEPDPEPLPPTEPEPLPPAATRRQRRAYRRRDLTAE